MFSGIVEESARVVALSKGEPPHRLVLESSLDHSQTEIGDSIAVSGVCLTVVEKKGSKLAFDVALETIRRSTIGSLTAGCSVNLERSLKVGARVHGHLVSGHVDATVELLRRDSDGNSDRLVFSLPTSLAPFVAPKGSITVSGVSLTVGECEAGSFSVYIVPHTSQVTTLSDLKVGDKVNLEVDMLARYTVRYLSTVSGTGEGAGNVDMKFLKEHGFA